MEKVRFPKPETRVTARLGDVQGSTCLRAEMMRYLSTPGGVELAAPTESADLTLSGKLTRIEVHSNRGDKEAAIAYFTAFVITAPIAAAMYGAKDWQADAAAEGELAAADGNGRVVWSKALTVSLAEHQRTLPTDDALKAAMGAAVCQKLALTLLNALTEALQTAPARLEH